MDWNIITSSLITLGGVLLGSLITYFINRQNIQFQAKEQDKDREEQRRELKIQTREKFIGRDVERCMDALDFLLKQYAHLRIINQQVAIYKEASQNRQLPQEIMESIALIGNDKRKTLIEIDQNFETLSLLVNSFGDEFHAELSFLSEAINSYRKVENSDREKEAQIYLRKTAGNLHRRLREKLISIRDSE